MHKDFNGKQNQYCSLLTCCQNSDTMVIDSNDCLSFAKGNILRKTGRSFLMIYYLCFSIYKIVRKIMIVGDKR